MPRPKLLDQVRDALRLRHYSIRTEDTYIQWIKRYLLFHNKTHPRDLGEAKISAFLTDLAVNKHVSASTQNQALSALLFLYQQVLGIKLDWLDDVVRAKRPKKLPVVLSQDEVERVLKLIPGIQELLGHKDVNTTMIYTHVMGRGGRGVKSPLDN